MDCAVLKSGLRVLRVLVRSTSQQYLSFSCIGIYKGENSRIELDSLVDRRDSKVFLWIFTLNRHFLLKSAQVSHLIRMSSQCQQTSLAI